MATIATEETLYPIAGLIALREYGAPLWRMAAMPTSAEVEAARDRLNNSPYELYASESCVQIRKPFQWIVNINADRLRFYIEGDYRRAFGPYVELPAVWTFAQAIEQILLLPHAVTL